MVWSKEQRLRHRKALNTVRVGYKARGKGYLAGRFSVTSVEKQNRSKGQSIEKLFCRKILILCPFRFSEGTQYFINCISLSRQVLLILVNKEPEKLSDMQNVYNILLILRERVKGQAAL